MGTKAEAMQMMFGLVIAAERRDHEGYVLQLENVRQAFQEDARDFVAGAVMALGAVARDLAACRGTDFLTELQIYAGIGAKYEAGLSMRKVIPGTSRIERSG